MDEHPFRPLRSHDWDVLMFYDYGDLDPDQDIGALLASYRESVVVAWSMGVWVGQRIFQSFLPQLQGALAINGTLFPIDDRRGIPEALVVATLAGLTQKQRLKFYLRMCRDRSLYKRFLGLQPRRGLESQALELAALLEKARLQAPGQVIYGSALISQDDRIMPSTNQLRAWPKKMQHMIAGSHFPFYDFESWDAILLEGGLISAITPEEVHALAPQ